MLDMPILSPPIAGVLGRSCFRHRTNDLLGFGRGCKLSKKERKVKFVVSAELSKAFSLRLGLDSEVSSFVAPAAFCLYFGDFCLFRSFRLLLLIFY